MAKSASGPAVLGTGLRVRGRVQGDGDLRVEATVEGDISVSGALELGPGANVRGGLSAASVRIAGAATGDIQASGPVAIAAGGSLQGDVRASALSLEEGGVFHGSIEADFELPDALA